MDQGIVRPGRGRSRLVALATVLVAGCGGSSSPGRSTPSTPAPAPSTSTATSTSTASLPTRARFIAEADRICRGAAGRLNVQQHTIDVALQNAQSDDTAANRAALAGALRRDEALVAPQLDRLRVMTPVGDRAVVGRYLAAVASQIRLIEQFAAAVEQQDRPALSVIAQQLTQGRTTAAGLAQAYGLRVCGSQ